MTGTAQTTFNRSLDPALLSPGRALRRSLVEAGRRGARVAASLAWAGLLGAGAAQADELDLARALHGPAAEHMEQQELVDLVRSGQNDAAFDEAFETGDELFETQFNAVDGVGARVGNGQRFTRMPRADLAGPLEWANHFPARATGPNAASCTACHNTPDDDGSGGVEGNVHRDPLHSGDPARIIERNTPHLFGAGAVQRLAEEMTSELEQISLRAARAACASGQRTSADLVAKGVSFGRITAIPTGTPCTPDFDTSAVVGLDADLVVRPFQWKGSIAFVRDFNRDAGHNEIGMQAVELVGAGVDGDGDGVSDELSVGDMTSLAVYVASQPRPTTRVELASLGLIPPLAKSEVDAIARGESTFRQVGCADCHVPRMQLVDPVFQEPSAHVAYRDTPFPDGQDPVSLGVDPRAPIRVDLTADQPDNRILDSHGKLVRLGSLTRDARGRANVDLYGDLKRHDMGPALAEGIDEVGTGASVFLTENLWGVGTTAPYLHDGRATTLAEAIALHGGEGAASRGAFTALPLARQQDVVAFLENMVLFKQPAAATAPAPAPAPSGHTTRRHRSRRR